MNTALVLYGPKAVGKTWVARVLQENLGVVYVNADDVIPRLVSEGREPHPDEGWLREIEAEVLSAVADSRAVSVEATGAWESDWKLPDELAAKGIRTKKVSIWAPLEVCMARLHARPFPPPIPDEEATWIHITSTRQAALRSFDLRLDTSSELVPADVVRAVRDLLHKG